MTTSSCFPVLAVAASMYTTFLFFKCKQRRKGSYNVHAAQSRNPRLNSNLECGTSSVHSSFRDITVHYQQERALSDDIAELERAGSLGERAGTHEPEPTPNDMGSEVTSSCGLIEPIEVAPELHSSTDHIQQPSQHLILCITIHLYLMFHISVSCCIFVSLKLCQFLCVHAL